MVLRHKPVDGCGGCVRGYGVDHMQLDATVQDAIRLGDLQRRLHARELLLAAGRLWPAQWVDGAEHERARTRSGL